MFSDHNAEIRNQLWWRVEGDTKHRGFSGGSYGKESAYSVEDLGSIPGSGRSPGGEHSNPLKYSCPENPMDRGALRTTVHMVTRVGYD